MYHFSPKSLHNLSECDPRLKKIANKALIYVDFAVIEGRRLEDRQNQLFNEGKSKVKWPDSKHNNNPSLAFDLLPNPYDWKNREAFIRFAAFIIGIGAGMGVELRWGGDWDRDWDLQDNKFNDWPHFEIVER